MNTKKNLESTPVTAIITTTTSAITEFKFKNPALNAHAVEIATAQTHMVDSVKEVAKALGAVKKESCYKEDGFKSVADFAEKTFGLKRSYAYMLANVGERFYNAEQLPEPVAELVDAMPVTNLAELVNVLDDKLETAIESGELTPTMTQTDAGNLAKKLTGEAAKESGESAKPAILNKYHVVATFGSEVHDFNEDYLLETDFAARVAEVFKIPYVASEWTPFKLSNVAPATKELPAIKRIGYTFPYHDSTSAVVLTYNLKRVGKPAKKSARPKMTREELLAMLAAFDEEEEG